MHSKVREADLLKTQAILVALTGILVLCGQIGPTAVDARQTAIQRVAGIKGDRLDAPRAVPLADSFATSVLFRADSLQHLEDVVGDFWATCDDDSIAELMATHP